MADVSNDTIKLLDQDDFIEAMNIHQTKVFFRPRIIAITSGIFFPCLADGIRIPAGQGWCGSRLFIFAGAMLIYAVIEIHKLHKSSQDAGKGCG